MSSFNNPSAQVLSESQVAHQTIEAFYQQNQADFDQFSQTYFTQVDGLFDKEGVPNFDLKRSFYFWKSISSVMSKTPLKENRGTTYSRAATGYDTLYNGFSTLYATGRIINSARIIDDPTASELEKNLAISTLVKYVAETPKNVLASLKPLTENYNTFNNLIQDAVSRAHYQASSFTQQYGLLDDHQVYLNRGVNSARSAISGLTSTAVQSSFHRLDTALQQYNQIASKLDQRVSGLATIKSDINNTAGLSYLDKLANNEQYKNGGKKTLSQFQSLVKGSTTDSPVSLASLQQQLADATKEVNASYLEHMNQLKRLKNVPLDSPIYNLMNLPAVDVDIANPILKNRGAMALTQLDFDHPTINVSYDFNKMAAAQPGSGAKKAGAGFGVAAALIAVGTASYQLAAGVDSGLRGLTEAQKRTQIASLSLNLLGETLGAVSAVIDLVATFSKVAKATGIAGVIIGAIGDVVKGIANAVGVFADPNADNTDKVLSIINIFMPAFNLLATKDAIELNKLLDDPSLTDAERWAYESLYREATLDSIPIVNWFSFIWKDDRTANAIKQLIEKYGDGRPLTAGAVLGDDVLRRFVENNTQNLIDRFYAEHFTELKQELVSWSKRANADQLIHMGYAASYYDLPARARSIWDQVIPQHVRDQVQAISKIVIAPDDQSVAEAEVTRQPFGEVTAGLHHNQPFYRHMPLNWRLGNEHGQPESVQANVSIIRVDRDFAGDLRAYDDGAVNNTVFYDSTGDRHKGYTYRTETVEVTRYRKVTGASPVGKLGVRDWVKWVPYTAKEQRQVKAKSIGDNIDHLDLGGGNDTVIVSGVDEILKVTTNDWVDFSQLTHQTRQLDHQDRGLDDTLYLTDVTSATVFLRPDSNDRQHRVDLHWQGISPKRQLSRAELENVESIILGTNNGQNDVSSILFRDDVNSFTLYAAGETPITVASENSQIGQRYHQGEVVGDVNNNTFDIQLPSIQNLVVSAGAGDDQVTVAIGSSTTNPGTVILMGGEGKDTLTVHSQAAPNTKHKLYIGDDHNPLNTLPGVIFVSQFEQVNGTQHDDHFLYQGGTTTLHGHGGKDVYELILDNAATNNKQMQATANKVIIDDTDSENTIILDVQDLSALVFQQTTDNAIDVVYQGQSRVTMTPDTAGELVVRYGDLDKAGERAGLITLNMSQLVATPYTTVDSNDLLTYSGNQRDNVYFINAHAGRVLLEDQGGIDHVVLTDRFDLTNATITDQQISQGNDSLQLNGVFETLLFSKDGITLRLADYLHFHQGQGREYTARDYEFVVADKYQLIQVTGEHNTYFFAPNSMNTNAVRINNANNTDVVLLSEQFNCHDIAVKQAGQDLVIQLGQTDGSQSIIIQDWYNQGGKPTLLLGDNQRLEPGEVELLVSLQAQLNKAFTHIQPAQRFALASQYAELSQALWDTASVGVKNHYNNTVMAIRSAWHEAGSFAALDPNHIAYQQVDPSAGGGVDDVQLTLANSHDIDQLAQTMAAFAGTEDSANYPSQLPSMTHATDLAITQSY